MARVKRHDAFTFVSMGLAAASEQLSAAAWVAYLMSLHPKKKRRTKRKGGKRG